jgi:hypothetical protein
MYSQIVIVALSGYPPGVNKLYCIVLYNDDSHLSSLLFKGGGFLFSKLPVLAPPEQTQNFYGHNPAICSSPFRQAVWHAAKERHSSTTSIAKKANSWCGLMLVIFRPHFQSSIEKTV